MHKDKKSTFKCCGNVHKICYNKKKLAPNLYLCNISTKLFMLI